MVPTSDRIDAYEETTRIIESTHLQSNRKHLPREIDIRMDLLQSDQFRLSNEGEERTLATSSAILTNDLNFFLKALNDMTSFC